MIALYINSTDYTEYLQDGSLSIVGQIQNKANTASFSLNPGTPIPAENLEVLIYDWLTLVSASGTALVLTDTLRSGFSALDFGKLRAGDAIFLGIGAATKEKVIIDTIEAGAAGQINITLTKSIVNAHSADEKVGRLIFGGTTTKPKSSNVKKLTDVEVSVSCTDFTKIFDKRNLNDSWIEATAQYIINDALDTTINYNEELDDMDYANDAAAQAVWTESSDGGNPVIDTTNFIQGTGAVSFPWTFAGGTAIYTGALVSSDVSALVGVSSGTPTKGNLTFWYKRSSAADISSLQFRVGSSATDYVQLTFDPEETTEMRFASIPLTSGGAPTGTPDWTALDYVRMLVNETANGSIIIDDIRITADGSFTMYNFEAGSEFAKATASFKKPTVFLDRLAKSLSYFWYIDYERDIHFFDQETNTAPFDITETSNNFDKLDISVDTSQLKNRQVVRGGTRESDSSYSQVIQGDDATREWTLKSKFVDLEVWLDNNTSTDTMEATTTTTTVKATAHGLVDGDWIVNRTQGAARQISYVDADHFTVLEVTGQASGDTFSKFATQKTVGVENLDDETLFDYMRGNSESLSVRAASGTGTLTATDYLLFIYTEIIPIRVQVDEPTSIAAMKALGIGDGIFEGAVITDESLDSRDAARDRARAEIYQYSNPIVQIDFVTDYEGLKEGQLVRVTDSNRNIDDDYLIQKVKANYKAGDFVTFSVTCASSLFGIIEYFQQLSTGLSERNIDEDEVIDQLVTDTATVTVTEANTFVASETASESATVTVSEVNTSADRDMTTDPYVWQPDASDFRWNLGQWG